MPKCKRKKKRMDTARPCSSLFLTRSKSETVLILIEELATFSRRFPASYFESLSLSFLWSSSSSSSSFLLPINNLNNLFQPRCKHELLSPFIEGESFKIHQSANSIIQSTAIKSLKQMVWPYFIHTYAPLIPLSFFFFSTTTTTLSLTPLSITASSSSSSTTTLSHAPLSLTAYPLLPFLLTLKLFLLLLFLLLLILFLFFFFSQQHYSFSRSSPPSRLFLIATFLRLLLRTRLSSYFFFFIFFIYFFFFQY